MSDAKDLSQNLTARELMSPKALFCLSKTPIKDAVKTMQDANTGSIVIVDKDQKVLGILTERDVLKNCHLENFLSLTADKVMTSPVETVDVSKPLHEIHLQFGNAKFRHLPVVENGSLAGMISMRDLFRHWTDLVKAERDDITSKYNRTMRVIVHDLRSPIYAVRSMNEMLLTGFEEPASYLEAGFPGMIDSSCLTMAQLIDDLLDFSKVKDGQVDLEQEDTNIVEVLEGVIRSFEPNAMAKKIKIDFKDESKGTPLFLDRRRMVQVFQNLLSNSIKYSDLDSHVEVEVIEEEGQTHISFVDHGQGIKESEIGVIFDELCKVSSMPTNEEPSTGLGLSITKRLVEAHGGTIGVKSEAYKETRFTISFPHEMSEQLAA